MLGIPYSYQLDGIPLLGILSLGIPVKHGRNTHKILYAIYLDDIPLLGIPSLGIPSLGIPVKHGQNTHHILYLI